MFEVSAAAVRQQPSSASMTTGIEQVAGEDRVRGYARLYWGLTGRQRSADIPLSPELMWENVGVPLHPGAARYYRQAGLMPQP
jgi:hypothetical protein